MAAITSSNVTLVRSWERADLAGWAREKVSDLAITLSAQGGTAGDIPASALGFAKIYCAVCLSANISSTMVGGLVCVAPDGSEIFPVDLTQATDANRAKRANITGTLYVRVTGTPKL